MMHDCEVLYVVGRLMFNTEVDKYVYRKIQLKISCVFTYQNFT